MKVLLINTAERKGGAAVACRRLKEALAGIGVQVAMLVRDKQTEDPDVHVVAGGRLVRFSNFLRFAWERFVIWVINGFSRKQLFAVSAANTGRDISRSPEVREADVFHIHWVNQGFLSLKDIRRLVKTGKPVVWTMHDMWAFTGICHYAGECGRYRQECGCCPQLRFPGKRDLSARNWRRKVRLFKDADIRFVGCSHWMAEMARESKLLENAVVTNIPNPIDIHLFEPKEKAFCREILGLPVDKRLLLFGADRLDDSRKGFVYLAEALQLLLEKYPDSIHELEIVVFGGQKNDIASRLPYRVHHLGYVSNIEKIVQMYNAADAFIIPSLEDNLPNTIMESMACGTPVIGFDTGGIPEMVDHKVNGYVATSRDSSRLMQGIYWLLYKTDYAVLAAEARDKVVRTYAPDVVAKRYLRVYEGMIVKQ